MNHRTALLVRSLLPEITAVIRRWIHCLRDPGDIQDLYDGTFTVEREEWHSFLVWCASLCKCCQVLLQGKSDRCDNIRVRSVEIGVWYILAVNGWRHSEKVRVCVISISLVEVESVASEDSVAYVSIPGSEAKESVAYNSEARAAERAISLV